LGLLGEGPAVRAELDISPTAGVVMAIGSVQRPKGHWLLLEALAQLSQTVELVLVTGGAPREYAQSRRGRIKRAFGLPLDNLDALMREAHRRDLNRRIHVTGFRTDVAR